MGCWRLLVAEETRYQSDLDRNSGISERREGKFALELENGDGLIGD